MPKKGSHLERINSNHEEKDRMYGANPYPHNYVLILNTYYNEDIGG